MSLFVEYCIHLAFHDLFLSSKELMTGTPYLPHARGTYSQFL